MNRKQLADVIQFITEGQPPCTPLILSPFSVSELVASCGKQPKRSQVIILNVHGQLNLFPSEIQSGHCDKSELSDIVTFVWSVEHFESYLQLLKQEQD